MNINWRAAQFRLLAWPMAAQDALAADAGPQINVPSGGNATRLTDIHDIKPALQMGADIDWIYWVIGVALLLAIAYLVLRRFQQNRKRPTERPEMPQMAPEVEACQALDALAADSAGSAKAFYFRLSAILRRYIERRYGFPAAEMTTEELLPAVHRLALEPHLVQSFNRFCRESDPIKFADVTPAAERMPRDLAFVRYFVQQTTLREEAAQKDAATDAAATSPLTETTT